ncbi:MAG: hypothetical protein ACD_2C00130G0004 [uncultured bacterium (gcode 4)]|uniref:Uncharacterized protein n=1 Tax=uncultured bacterium (gcode 4) TaxID=1234023 RepID=K2G398_9BACT|nr:MAG: hypothetical protein ACD_2C00130G0004 [uncultured bacterium (gcode 4)]
MAFKLDISWHTSTLMITSVIYKKLSDLLASKGKKELFSFIKSVKIRGAAMSIKTEKPIVNSELQLYKSEIEDILISVSATFWIRLQEAKITFK